jgi:galactan 5-O-arabinofuranosyltransferase
VLQTLTICRGRRVTFRAAGWPAAEFGLVLVGVAAGAALVHAVITASNFSALDEVAKGFGPPWAALMILLAVAAHLVQRHTAHARAIVAALAGVAGGLVTAPLSAGLHGTDQPLNSILRGDMAFRTEYVTRFASTWHLRDFTFGSLHAFYPPGWFWVAGRSAHLLGLHEPWHIVKPFTILTIGAALVVAYLLWRMVLSPAGALSAAIGSSLVLAPQVGNADLSTQSWYEPYSCFVAIAGIAWLAATLSALRAPHARGRLVVLGLVGAALALTYYLLFLILAVVLVVLVALPHRERSTVLTRCGALLGGMALLTAPFWVPLLSGIAHGAASQGQFVRPDFLKVSVGIAGGPVALAVLATVAVVGLALTVNFVASQAVGALIVGTIAYQLISVTTLVFASNQLQPHRAVTMMWAGFGAAVPVAFEGFERGALADGPLAPWLPRAAAVVALTLAIPAIFVIGSDQGADLAGGIFSRTAHERPALGQTRLISSFITGTAGRPAQDLTVLSGDHALLVTQPYDGFLPLRARYAHPDAHLDQRLGVVRAAARCRRPACTTRLLTTNRFGPVDALVLAREVGGFRVDTQEDAFPEPVPVTINFRRGSFDPRVWARANFGGYAVFVRRPPL